MKKIELHLHLEGAAPPAFIRGLAAEKGHALPAIFDEGGNYRFDGFRDFLRVYDAVSATLQGPRDYARLLRVVLEECAENGAIHVELFVSPDFCGGGDLPAWRDHLAAMEEVARDMRAQGIGSSAILTALRHLDPAQSKKAAICAAETAGDWVAGFGMAGAETAAPARDFAWAFDCAREAGLGLTCHAGEWGGPSSIREALSLGVTRIGHGIRAVEDPALVRHLAESGITLECCPGSNLALGLCRDLRAHPIAQLADAGVRVTVSTDDPPFFRTDLRREYQGLADAFGWAEAEFTQMNQWAIDAAFCKEEVKEHLRKELT